VATSTRPTTRELADSIAIIEQRTEELLNTMESLQASSQQESQKVWTTLGSIAGLDGLTVGFAAISELLAPLRLLVPPSTALPLEPGVPGALITMRAALGGRRDTNFDHVTTDWDGPVGYIGQPDPSLDPPDPSYYEEPVT
jgi:hypothetical protein